MLATVYPFHHDICYMYLLTSHLLVHLTKYTKTIDLLYDLFCLDDSRDLHDYVDVYMSTKNT